jgi:hypothetical protein
MLFQNNYINLLHFEIDITFQNKGEKCIELTFFKITNAKIKKVNCAYLKM